MTDHRTLPGIEWVSSPGPLRVGDYYRFNDGDFFVYVFVYVVLDEAHEINLSTNIFVRRVIPVFRPLEVPEPCEVDEVETMEAEVCTCSSPEHDTHCMITTPDWYQNAEGYWRSSGAYSMPADSECIQITARRAAKARAALVKEQFDAERARARAKVKP